MEITIHEDSKKLAISHFTGKTEPTTSHENTIFTTIATNLGNLIG